MDIGFTTKDLKHALALPMERFITCLVLETAGGSGIGAPDSKLECLRPHSLGSLASTSMEVIASSKPLQPRPSLLLCQCLELLEALKSKAGVDTNKDEPVLVALIGWWERPMEV